MSHPPTPAQRVPFDLGRTQRRKTGAAYAAVLVVGMLEGLVFLQIVESNPDFEHGVLRPALQRLLRSLQNS